MRFDLKVEGQQEGISPRHHGSRESDDATFRAAPPAGTLTGELPESEKIWTFTFPSSS